MNLLDKKEIKKIKDDELARAQKINEYMSAKTRELNDFKKEHEDKKKAILSDFVAFAQGIARQKSGLESGLSTTEERKLTAFNSLASLSVNAEGKYELAKKIESTFSLREEKLGKREVKLEERIKVIDERENMLNGRASSLSARSQVVQVEEDRLEIKKIQANTDILEREKKIKRQEQVIDDRLIDLNLAAQANKKTAELLEERERQINEDLRIEKIQLKDGREALARGFEELRNKQK